MINDALLDGFHTCSDEGILALTLSVLLEGVRYSICPDFGPREPDIDAKTAFDID